jgi:hypothetical protein
MVFFGVMSILFSQSQIPDFDQIWWLSIVAFVMSFTYCSIGLSLDIAQTICKLLIQSDWLDIHPLIDGFLVTGLCSIDAIAATSSSYVLIQAISSFMLSSVCFALAEYMRIWITMPPACRIGSRYPRSSFRAPTPTTGVFKGSGMRIGRARDALPAGRSHGTPTFARAGDCSVLLRLDTSLLFINFVYIHTTLVNYKLQSLFCCLAQWQLPPHKCDWFPIMGSTVINTDGKLHFNVKSFHFSYHIVC